MSGFELKFRPFPDAGGPISWALVPWDSKAFGFSVYELRVLDAARCTHDLVEGWLSTLPAETERLVCAKVDQAEVPALVALASNGFYPVEAVLEAEGELKRADTIECNPGIPVRLRPAREADLESMTAIAASAFWSDRFHLDPYLSNDSADRRYVEWIQRAYEAGEPLYGYVREDALIGFYHVRPITDDRVDLMLAAVDPSLAGMGLGSVLYQLMMFECLRLGFVRAETRIVARNLPVLNIFARLRFSFRSAMTTLHWHSGRRG